VRAFHEAGVERVCVNAAGCGAIMREYGELLADDPAYAAAAADVSARVRDVSELLAGAGPRPGVEIRARVAYDPPCHLLHAQGVDESPARVLDAVPGLVRVPVERASECCGGAGVYGMTHPALGGRIGTDKAEALLASGADLVATGNPGCAMQIGATMKLRGDGRPVVHPVELLDESYRRAGLYDAGAHDA
jgi:glycolate oxidase iron-sulfur subunit